MASSDLRWATATAPFAELLRRSPHLSETTWRDVLRLAEAAKGDDPHRAELCELVARAAALASGLDAIVVPVPDPVRVSGTARR